MLLKKCTFTIAFVWCCEKLLHDVYDSCSFGGAGAGAGAGGVPGNTTACLPLKKRFTLNVKEGTANSNPMK